MEENNFSDKTVNAYIVYDLDYCQRNLLNGFVIKNCLLSVTKIVRNSDKSKYVHSGFGIAFDWAGSYSFGNDFARKVVSFGADNNPSLNTGNCKNKVLVFSEGAINHLSNAKTKLCLSLHYNGVLVVIITAQLHSTKPELKFCEGSNPVHGVPEICDAEDLW